MRAATQFSPHHRQMELCIQNCEKCHDVCIKTLSHCITQGGAHASDAHITLLRDCIQICQTSADFMLRGSTLHSMTCWVCAEICSRCAEDCERIAPLDKHMQACVQACRACAAACRQMAAVQPA